MTTISAICAKSVKIGFTPQREIGIAIALDDGEAVCVSVPVKEWQRMVKTMEEEIEKEGLNV